MEILGVDPLMHSKFIHMLMYIGILYIQIYIVVCLYTHICIYGWMDECLHACIQTGTEFRQSGRQIDRQAYMQTFIHEC